LVTDLGIDVCTDTCFMVSFTARTTMSELHPTSDDKHTDLQPQNQRPTQQCVSFGIQDHHQQIFQAHISAFYGEKSVFATPFTLPGNSDGGSHNGSGPAPYLLTVSIHTAMLSTCYSQSDALLICKGTAW
jgi:hypothetical protein